MAADPVVVRLTRSAVKKIIDFADTDFFDPDWHRYVNVMAGGMADMERVQSLEFLLQIQAIQAPSPGASDEARRAYVDEFVDRWGEYIKAKFPWHKNQPTAKEQAVALYREVMGDPDSPELRAELAAFTEKYKRNKAREALADKPQAGYDEVPAHLLQNVITARAKVDRKNG